MCSWDKPSLTLSLFFLLATQPFRLRVSICLKHPHMKRLYTAILFAGILVLGFNCQKEISYASNNLPGSFNHGDITTTLEGNIIDENGQPASGVMIKAGNKNAST